MDAISKVDKEPSDLSDEDFKQAVAKFTQTNPRTNKKFSTTAGFTGGNRDQNLAAATAVRDQWLAGDKGIFKGTDKDQPIVKGLSQTQKDAGDAIDLGTGEDRFASIPSVDMDYQDIAGDFKQGELKPNRALDATTLAVFRKEIEEHGTLTEMFSHYEDLSKKIRKASNPNASDEDKKGIANMSTEELFNSASVMATLNYLINTFLRIVTGKHFC